MPASLRNPEALAFTETLITDLENLRARYRNLAACGFGVPGRQDGATIEHLNGALTELTALAGAMREAGALLEAR